MPKIISMLVCCVVGHRLTSIIYDKASSANPEPHTYMLVMKQLFIKPQLNSNQDILT